MGSFFVLIMATFGRLIEYIILVWIGQSGEGFSWIWWVLRAWNADFRGFGGFSRIFSG
ncbi:MAG: hypothetical protein FWG87_01195 [Defluviitaleaceae bacterium]|nr:hypothetical protein [Defluviitaleaceae bacterium]